MTIVKPTGQVSKEVMMAKKDETKKLPEVEKLEKKAAPSGKKNPSPSPYPPGTKYGLIKRSNLG